MYVLRADCNILRLGNTYWASLGSATPAKPAQDENPALLRWGFLFAWFTLRITEEFQGNRQLVLNGVCFILPMSFPSCPPCSNTFGALDSGRDETTLCGYIWLGLIT